jgi:Mycothiol maleylpyruvate isomerase N-terminal domain
VSDYHADVQTLEAELARVEQAFRGLTESDWRRPTLLQPLDEGLPRWTLFELAGHFDISIGLTRMLISSQQDGQVGRDRVSFFIFSRVEHAPAVYDYAFTMVEGKSPGQMAGVLAETFTRTIEEARAAPPDLVGSGYYALMQLGEFVPSRVVEAVVHGLDLTDALGQDPIATPEGVAMTAAMFDELLARRTVPGRPADLAEDMAWVRAASGRAPHADPRLPLIG